MAAVDTRALGQLRSCKNKLSRQQYLTLKGQVLAGDAEGAMKGLRRIMLLNGSNAKKSLDRR